MLFLCRSVSQIANVLLWLDLLTVVCLVELGFSLTQFLTSGSTSHTWVFVQRCYNKWYMSQVMSGHAIPYSHNTLFQTSSAPCPLHIMALVVLPVFKPSYKCPFRFFHKLDMQHFISQQKPFSFSFMLFLVNAKKRKDLKAADAVHWESLADRFPVCQVICLCVCCALWCCR